MSGVTLMLVLAGFNPSPSPPRSGEGRSPARVNDMPRIAPLSKDDRPSPLRGGEGEGFFCAEPTNSRKPASDVELRYWLDNMVRHHRFSIDEVIEATGLTRDEIAAALKRFDIAAQPRPKHKPGEALCVLPYPGGRHPRIGFLDGAVRPQRETKISVFTPWDPDSYVVVDVPEAIWSNLGLTYLAHTHVPTVWTKQNIDLPPFEWDRRDDGTLAIERKLPNGIAFAVKITPHADAIAMTMSLTNGTKEKLSDL